jgi:Ser/Thr protein kinase RdoA (MazF antagonist)
MEEHALAGGLGNEGRVVRVGDTVRRPAGPWTATVHRFLDHLAAAGFTGAPRPLARTGDTETVTYLPGEVAVPPFPAWSDADALLVSVAALQRRAHLAAAGFALQAGDEWGTGPLPPPELTGHLVCHNDLCRENVVVCDGRAVGFVDFDFTRPTHRLWDVAIAMRHWVPLADPADLEPERAGLDLVDRARRFLAVHDLTAAERATAVRAAGTFLDGALEFVRDQAAAGHTGHRAQWGSGYEGRNRRARAWVDAHRDALARG